MMGSFVARAQEASAPNSGAVTDTFTVAGNCTMCKKRIEAATDLKGVKSFSWNPQTRLATVSYRADKTSPDEIRKAIAAAGHDVAGYTATDKAYGKLPDCCKHRHVAPHKDGK